MRFVADNTINKNGTFEIELAVHEENMEDVIFSLCMGITRVCAQFLVENTDDKKEARTLSTIIGKMYKRLITDFINSGAYEEIKEENTEAELYRWMEEVFDNWLKETVGMSKDDFKKCFADSSTLFMEPYALENKIIILLANGEKQHLILREFPKSTVDNKEAFEKEVDLAFIVAVIAGDTLFTDKRNPIREKYTPGDKMLMESIRNLLK